MKNEQLREEFTNWYRTTNDVGSEATATWWLNKMEEALSHQKAELREVVERMKYEDERLEMEGTEYARGYKNAVNFFSALLSEPQI